MRTNFVKYIVASIVVAASGVSAPAFAAPDVGDMAPDWTLTGSDGRDYSLWEMRGKYVVVAFFPKAFTGG